jgi:hypothetical protein
MDSVRVELRVDYPGAASTDGHWSATFDNSNVAP